MRSIFTVSAAVALTFCSVSGAQAGSSAPVPARAAASEKARNASVPQNDGLVEVLAAEFFESTLRLAQSRQIEAETAKRYLSMDAADRAQFRAERKRLWRHMNAEQKQALRGVKRPSFANLDDGQKQTFRQIASETLGAGAPRSQSARGDI